MTYLKKLKKLFLNGFWQNDISNDFFEIEDHFFDASVIEKFDFVLYVKNIFIHVFSTDMDFQEKITLVENFNFHAQNIIITGKLNFHSLLKLTNCCTNNLNDQESNLFNIKIRKKYLRFLNQERPG